MLEHTPYRGYGDRIRILRERTGMSVESFAEQLGVAPYFIRRTELSEVYPTMPYIEALAASLGIDASYLARHIWTGESLKALVREETMPIDELRQAYEQTLGHDGVSLEEQLEARMRLFDLMYDEDVKRIEAELDPTEQRVFHELVDAVMEAGELQRKNGELEEFRLFSDKPRAMTQLDEYLSRFVAGEKALQGAGVYDKWKDVVDRSRYHRGTF